jgi:hypothetical protein
MEQIIKQLEEKAGLTEEQAIKALEVMKDFIQSKIPPMMHGMVENFLKDSEEE